MFAFQAELRSAFGLTVDQVNCATSNWLSLYGIEETNLWQSFSGPLANIYEVMYWQWAQSNVTERYNIPTITGLFPANVYFGWYEIFFFHSNYFKNHANPTNIATFQNV